MPHRAGYRYLPISGGAAVVSALVLVILWNEQPQRVALLTAIGFVLFLGALVMNLVYWAFVANRIYKPAAAADAETLAGLAARNLARTAFYVLGFVVFAVAAVVE